MLNDTDKRALESLLAEEDDQTWQLVIREFCNCRSHSPELIHELEASPLPRVRQAARAMSAHNQGDLANVIQVIQCGRRLSTWSGLEELCWLLCRSEYPDYRVDEGRRILDGFAEQVLALAADAGDTAENRVRILREVLACRHQFSGNRENYYDPANSHLNRVLITHRGIPLSLSLVYIFTGLRLGWNVYGVGTPGHYLAALDGVIFDPFFDGIPLDARSLAARFMSTPEECARTDFFKTTPVETAKRMLMNLWNALSKLEDEERCEKIGRYLEIVAETAEPVPDGF